MDKLFVYGIFLGERQRRSYGMLNPEYATVENYATVGNQIVQAVPAKGYTLTGLLVDVTEFDLDGRSTWQALDALERGYDRIIIKTTQGIEAYMYAERG